MLCGAYASTNVTQGEFMLDTSGEEPEWIIRNVSITTPPVSDSASTASRDITDFVKENSSSH
jgi:hypothetical protein